MQIEQLTSFLYDYGLRFIIALIILLLGFLLVKGITKLMRKSMVDKFDKTLSNFIISIVKNLLLILVVLSAVSTVGIEITSFVAILGGASFAVGLALQGSLSNFAGGVLLLIFKPFQAGDFIDAGGSKGEVVEIQILYTILDTRDNKRIFVPNGSLANETITNFSTNPTRRLEVQFGIGYDDDFEEAKTIIKDIVNQHDAIKQEPEPIIRVGEHEASSIEIYTWVWIDNADYWKVYFDLHEKVKSRFDAAGIGIPYPQIDIHFNPEVEKSFISNKKN